MAEAYIVIGPPRTGTSLTMGVVAKMGIWVGGEKNMRKGQANPNYYEHRQVKEYIHQHISAQELIDSLRREPKWGMKHPRMVWRWHELEPHLEDPRFIVTHRLNKTAQIKSHNKYIKRQSPDEIMERTKRYYAEIDDKLRGKYPILDVWFEDFFEDGNQHKQLSALSDFCGMPITQAVTDFIDPKHRHDHRYDKKNKNKV